METLRQHGVSRWLQRFDLEEMLRDWGRLNEVVLTMVNRYFDENLPQETEARTRTIHQTNGFFTEAACVSVARYDKLRQQETARELEELKQMRRYFEQIEEARQHLLSNATHDIGGSLTAISGVSQLLKHDQVGDDDQALPEFGSIIEESVTSATKVLDSLLQLAHLDSGEARLELEKVELGACLGKWIERIAADLETEVEFRMNGPEGFFVLVDPGKLQRTIGVLIDFALADPASGPLLIECEAGEDSWTLMLRASRDAEFAGKDAGMTERRRDVYQLLLRRLSFFQKATLRFDEDGATSGTEAVLLRFPLSYEIGRDSG